MYDLLDRRLHAAQRRHEAVALMRVHITRNAREEIKVSDIINCAELLERHLRPDDTVGRMGFYDFLVVLAPEKNSEAQNEALKKIMARCQAKSDQPLHFSATLSQAHEKLSTLLNRLEAQASDEVK